MAAQPPHIIPYLQPQQSVAAGLMPVQTHSLHVINVSHQHTRLTWHALSPDPEQCRDLFDTRRRTFTLFRDLPTEIRLKIWAYTCPGRVIELRSWGNKANNFYVPIKFSAARHAFPIILHISQESRREGLRFYKKLELGVSTTTLRPNRKYIPWENHPRNPSAQFILHDTGSFPLALPYPTQRLYVDFSQDIIYLGPEFKIHHFQDFLAATELGTELADVQHLALNRKIWVSGAIQYAGSGFGSGFEYLRQALYSLSRRPLKALYIIPDDEPNNLADKYYYRKHEITLRTPPYTYEFRPEDRKTQENAKTVVENLDEWMQRLWIGREVPRIEIRSLRREDQEMGNFKNGMWEIQKLLGDMAAWKSWVPRDP